MARALEDDAAAAEVLERGLDVGEGVGFGGVRLDADALEGAVRVEHAEEAEGADEVVYDLDARGVGVAVAGRGEGVDAGAVFVVFVGPEVLVCAAVFLALCLALLPKFLESHSILFLLSSLRDTKRHRRWMDVVGTTY